MTTEYISTLEYMVLNTGNTESLSQPEDKIVCQLDQEQQDHDVICNSYLIVQNESCNAQRGGG